MILTQREQARYEDAWQWEAYKVHSPGQIYAPLFLDHATPPATVLDVGCGTGKGALALQAAGFTVALTDLTASGLDPAATNLPFFRACLWRTEELADLPIADYVYCCDVIEHLPPTFTLLVIQHLLNKALKGVFLSISLQPDQFGVWTGGPLHLTVQDFQTWKDQLQELADVVEARDLGGTGIYYLRPRR